MPHAELRFELCAGLAELDPARWDALVPEGDPCLEHAFLAGLEVSGSVGPRTGWRPRHLLAWRGRELVAAMPLYERHDSFGEYIFDFAIARAALRAGLDYYPKLTSAVPFTPIPGRRLLTLPGEPRPELALRFGERLRALPSELGVSSVHVLFLSPDEQDGLARAGLTPRLWNQFQWHRRPGWRSFDDFLAAMRAPSRKQVRRERAIARGHGLELVMKDGPELTDVDWAALEHFYRRTASEKGGRAFLRPAFFAWLRERAPARVAGALAYDHGEPAASAFFLHRGLNLYGRYWGARGVHDCLHFELCYYLPIAWALERGFTRFEGGAQGEHKLRRGLMPAACHSSHFIADETLRVAVDDYLAREREAVLQEIELLAAHGPFHRADGRSPASSDHV